MIIKKTAYFFFSRSVFGGKSYFENFLVHEMVHAYDDQQGMFSKLREAFHGSPEQLQAEFQKKPKESRLKFVEELCTITACTEIRAVQLSQQCEFASQLKMLRPFMPSQTNFENCIRDTAGHSVQLHFLCRPEKEKWIDKAWPKCFNSSLKFRL